MARLNTYPEQTAQFGSDQSIIIDGNSGVKKMSGANAGIYLLAGMSPEQHRLIFRGKNLGTSPTSTQLDAINAGTFNDIFLGDYWQNGGINYRIVDINYWQYCGDSSFAKNHVVVVPDTALITARMEASNITTNGYYGSEMRTTNFQTTSGSLGSINQSLKNIFGTSLLTHREYLTNAAVDGRPTAAAWYDSMADLMDETMVYGGRICTSENSDGSSVAIPYTINTQQFALFSLFGPKFSKVSRTNYWLRNVVSSALFANVGARGCAACSDAFFSFAVRPCFAIGKA